MLKSVSEFGDDLDEDMQTVLSTVFLKVMNV